VRRDARRSERRSLGGGGRLSLRRALGLALALAGAGLIVAAPLSSGLLAASSADPSSTTSSSPAATSGQSPTPTPPTATPTPCNPLFENCGHTPRPTPTFPSFTPIPTPTPTPVPTPPPTAAPTVPPTSYAEPVVQGADQQTLIPVATGPTITPQSNGSSSSLPDLALVGAVVFAMIAGASFFLFFRIR